MNQINDKEKTAAMIEAAKSIKEVIEARLNSRLDMLNTLSVSSIDSLPESIRKMREDESAKIRAVIQEQRDLIATIKALYPDGKN